MTYSTPQVMTLATQKVAGPPPPAPSRPPVEAGEIWFYLETVAVAAIAVVVVITQIDVTP